MPITYSPLRYPGGKTQLAPFVIELLRQNDLFDGIYVEPFAGGAGIAWKLLLDGYVSEIWINDFDPSIYAFWHSVLHSTEELCSRIEESEISLDQWHKQKEVQSKKKVSLLDLGFSTFFLNRTNRSGILKGGVIGGLQQTGNYLLDCRFNKHDLLQKIQRIAMYRDQVKLTKLDAKEYVQSQIPMLPMHSLVNIDPPYYRKGPELYCSFYAHDDHVALAKAVRRIKQPWMLTYDNTSEIRELYSGLPSIIKELNYSAQTKRVGVELFVFDPRLQLPTSMNSVA